MTARERKERCGRCNGRGTITTTYDDYGMADPKTVPCSACKGTGTVTVIR